MRYLDNSTVAVNDDVVGTNKAGGPVAGKVLAVNAKDDTIQISPALSHPAWVPAGNCLPATRLQDAKPPAAETTPPAAPAKVPDGNTGPAASESQGGA